MRILPLTLLTASVLLLAGCASAAGAGSDPTTSDPDSTAGPIGGELTVYAAASLKTSFEEIVAAFEQAHPSVQVKPLVTDGSQVLATQLSEGASADVFASADEKNMDRLGALATDPRLFATNTLVLAVPKGNPAHIQGLEDLADDAKVVVLCAPEVPCGAASQQLLGGAGVAAHPDSLEQNVGAVLTKVAAGEADAGLVYRTDAAVGDVDAIEAEGAEDVVSTYPIAALADAPNRAAAQAFVDFVTGAEGQEILADAGFGTP